MMDDCLGKLNARDRLLNDEAEKTCDMIGMATWERNLG